MSDASPNSAAAIKYASLQRLPSSTNEIGPTTPLLAHPQQHLQSAAPPPTSNGRGWIPPGRFKASSKKTKCNVLMLDGTQRSFDVDKNAYGGHIFEQVVNVIGLHENEYFGLVYRDDQRCDNWLVFDEKLSKQLKNQSEWALEFRVRYYPKHYSEFGYLITRYFLWLQLRQDLLSGQLPCSYWTYVVLGSYVAQSALGDFDSCQHDVRGSSMGLLVVNPKLAQIQFAPPSMPDKDVTSMLQDISEMHRARKGLSPSEADEIFMDEVSRMARYGLETHKAKLANNEPVTIGINHKGLAIYRDYIRLTCIKWTSLESLEQVRSKITAHIIQISRKSPPGSPGSTKRKGSSSRKPSLSKSIKASPTMNKKSANSNGQITTSRSTLTFNCETVQRAKRLFESCKSAHAFYRLRDTGTRHRADLSNEFSTIRYKPQPTLDRPSFFAQPFQHGTMPPTMQSPSPKANNGIDRSAAPRASLDNPDQMSSQPGKASPVVIPVSTNQNQEPLAVDAITDLPIGYRRPPPQRVQLPKALWTISPADSTHGLGMDSSGKDVAAMQDSDWQGCRTNKGIKDPGAYCYEAIMVDPGSVLLGWSTDQASLRLGTDRHGFGYGAVDRSGAINPFSPPLPSYKAYGSYPLSNGGGDPSQQPGQFLYANLAQPYGLQVVPGDCIGCFVEIGPVAGSGHGNASDSISSVAKRQIIVQWSRNGQLFEPPELREPLLLDAGEALFPAASLRDSRVLFNFGQDERFHYPPPASFKSPRLNLSWLPVGCVDPSRAASNRNAGWMPSRVDVSSTTKLLLSENARVLQAVAHSGWQGCRANKGLFGGGKYYYEATLIEHSGLARFGWSYEGASYDLGSDSLGYGYGADRDGYGINNCQGKKMHANTIECYGEPLSKGDVVGCFLDLDQGFIRFAKNGLSFSTAYRLDPKGLAASQPLFPAVALVDTTVEFNFGDQPFKYSPDIDYIPVFACSDDNVYDPSKIATNQVVPTSQQNQRKLKQPSTDRLEDVLQLHPHHQPRAVRQHEPFEDSRQITSSRTTVNSRLEMNARVHVKQGDQELTDALLSVTQLDPNIMLITNKLT